MSWKVINEVLGLAVIDSDFCRKLMASPVIAIEEKGFQLTQAEKEALLAITARDIYEFSELALELLPIYKELS
jgi:hypothetical protein